MDWRRLQVGRSNRNSPLDRGVQPTQHREASSACLRHAKPQVLAFRCWARDRMATSGCFDAGEGAAAQIRGGRVGGEQVRVGGTMAVRVVSRPKSASATGPASRRFVFRPKSASATGRASKRVVSRPKSASATGQASKRFVSRPGSGSAAGSAVVWVVFRPGSASVTGQASKRFVFRPGTGSAAPASPITPNSVARRLSRTSCRPTSDISAPTQDLTGVRCASAGWSGRVSVN